MGTFLGVPIIRTIVFWGLCWGSPIHFWESTICGGLPESVMGGCPGTLCKACFFEGLGSQSLGFKVWEGFRMRVPNSTDCSGFRLK